MEYHHFCLISGWGLILSGLIHRAFLHKYVFSLWGQPWIQEAAGDAIHADKSSLDLAHSYLWVLIACIGHFAGGTLSCAKASSWKEYIESLILCYPWRCLRCYPIQVRLAYWPLCELFRPELQSSSDCGYCCEMWSLGTLLALAGHCSVRLVVHGAWSWPRFSLELLLVQPHYWLQSSHRMLTSSPGCYHKFDCCYSSSSFLTMHGGLVIMPTTRRLCLWSAMKTLSLALVSSTACLRRTSPRSMTTTRCSRRHRFIPFSACSLCRHWAGSITSSQTPWVTKCTHPGLTRVIFMFYHLDTAHITACIQHFYPSSPLFKPHERNGIIASNVGLSAMTCFLYFWTRQVGFHNFLRLYLVPYLVSTRMSCSDLKLKKS